MRTADLERRVVRAMRTQRLGRHRRGRVDTVVAVRKEYALTTPRRTVVATR
jgi:hypothetical protein